MSEVAILANKLSKQYRIGKAQPRYRTIRETITDAAQAPFRRAANILRGQPYGAAELADTIWALKDVSFEIKRGEVVGVIGRNGAGKTTLLKILSRITEPTQGSADIYGRVGSLLEVGTGFHPELTGRENIFLNGAILGMKRAEIERKFDEIVEFAEIAKFIDTPVKHYSSGMYVRLAFSVAAHLETEILLVDEVLAVGDASFQQKCLQRMSDVADGGRTVLFVSHNMTAVSNLCQRVFLINQGEICSSGLPEKVIQLYLASFSEDGMETAPGDFNLLDRVNPYATGQLIIQRARLLSDESSQDTFTMGQSMTIAVDVRGMSGHHDSLIGIIIKSKDNQCLTSINTGMICSHVDKPRKEHELAILRIPNLPLTPGSYKIAISVTHGRLGRIDYVDSAAQFQVLEADIYGSGYQLSSKHGYFFLNGSWEIRDAAKFEPLMQK